MSKSLSPDGEPGAEKRCAARREGCGRVGNSRWKCGSRGRGLDPCVGHDRHGLERNRVGYAPHMAFPRQARAACERGCEVVRVALEVDPEREQLLRIRLALRERRAGDEPERDRRGARPEPARERDAVEEPERAALDRRKASKRLEREMRLVARELVGALSDDLDARAVGDLELVPEIERAARAIEPRAEVGGARRRAEDHAAAAAIESGSGSTAWPRRRAARPHPDP